ncbi:MAG: M48 family metallopeptidase [Clostridia bacterium]|nr:M48 family metallopeptidase [Clostridia bacterium]
MKEARTYTTGDKLYAYTFERKKVKNLTLRVKSDGSLHISAPQHTPLARVEEFLSAQVTFIEKARKKLADRQAAQPKPLCLITGEAIPIWGISHTVWVIKANTRYACAENGILTLAVKDPENHAERIQCFAEFLDREARTRLTPRTKELTPIFAPKPPKVPSLAFRTMKTKWGVCRPTQGRVTLSRNLVFLPPALVDYVICHELAHFHHADHSTAFWQYLATVMPDHKERKKALNAFPIPKLEECKTP